jgi:glutamate-1-semialdehyde 2,1-aminomutase
MANNLLLNEGYTNNKYIFDRGMGSKIYIKKKKFIDLSFSAGSLLLGHNSKIFNQAIKDILKNKISIFANPNKQADDFAKIIKKIYPYYSKFIFCSTGSEAIMKSLRIVKAITKKDLIINVSGSWHGSNDKTLFTADRKLKVQSLSEGLSKSDRKNLRFIPYNDIKKSKIILDKNKKRISCILIEPIQGGLPDINALKYLKFLKTYSNKNKIILIFDEMITGLRIDGSSFQTKYNVKPDISTFGKCFGGGFPIGIIALNKNIDVKIKKLKKKIFFGGTFSGNSLSTYVGKLTVDYILKNKKKIFLNLENKSNYLFNSLSEIIRTEKISVSLYKFHSILRIVFTDKKVNNRVQRDFFEKKFNKNILNFRKYLLSNNINYPSNGIIFLSDQTEKKDIKIIIKHISQGLIKFFRKKI